MGTPSMALRPESPHPTGNRPTTGSRPCRRHTNPRAWSRSISEVEASTSRHWHVTTLFIVRATVTREGPRGNRVGLRVPRRSADVVVASEGFEPPNAEQSDLQSDPFGRLGNSPERTRPTWTANRGHERQAYLPEAGARNRTVSCRSRRAWSPPTTRVFAADRPRRDRSRRRRPSRAAAVRATPPGRTETL